MSAKQILVIVIDPENKTIEADTIDDNLESMQQMLGGNIQRVPDVPLGDGAETLWCDEEGKLKENFHFHIKGYPDIIAGKAFICREAYDEDGYVNADTELDVATLQELVEWLPHLDNAALL